MFWKEKVPIPMTMYRNFKPWLPLCRLFGIFPLTMRRSPLRAFMEWSTCHAVYGFVLALVSITTLFAGVFLQSGATMDIMNNVDNLVYTVVVVVYCISTFIGAFITPSRFPELRKYIKYINQVDAIIDISATKSARSKLNCLAAITIAITVISMGEVVYIYVLIVPNLVERINKIIVRVVFFVTHVYISQVVGCVIRLLTQMLNASITRVNDILDEHYIKIKNGGIHDAANITEMNKAYLKLMNAAKILNNIFELSILTVMTTAVFQLISTPYYLILSLEQKRRGYIEITLRILLILQQISRILLLVEPAHECMLSVKATGRHVCNLMSLNIGRKYRKQVNAMATSIFLNELKFSVCGFFDIDRFLITTLVGTVTTYVVILLQAQEEDNG